MKIFFITNKNMIMEINSFKMKNKEKNVIISALIT